MTIDIRLTIALDPQIQGLLGGFKAEIQAAQLGNSDGPQLAPATNGPAEPAMTNGTAPPAAKRGRGRPPKAASTPAPAPAPVEPDQDPDPLADFPYPLESKTVRNMMMLLASQTDRDEAVRTMAELAGTAEKPFTFTNVSSIPVGDIPYMIEGLLYVVDLAANDRQGHRLLAGEIDAADVLQP
jgi:hypothetical protein